MFGIGTQEILFIALIVLLFFGGKKVPEMMRGIGKGVRSFKEGMKDIDIESGMDAHAELTGTGKMAGNVPKQMSLGDHLDELRMILIKMAVVTVACGTAAFWGKEWLFGLVLAPIGRDFIAYRLLQSVSGVFSGDRMSISDVPLVNTGLAEQFMTHMRLSFWVGVICAFPYILYQLFRFVSPALYGNERKYAFKLTCWGYIMFMAGAALGYFLVFPLVFRFLRAIRSARKYTT